MVVTLESIEKNKELYNNSVEKKTQELSQLMKKLVELKRGRVQNSSEENIATCDFEEAKVRQELNSLTSSLKQDKLTLMLLGIQENALQGKIDQITFSNSSVTLKKAKEKLSKESEVVYCKDEVHKCKKALELFILIGDSEKVEEWQEKLKKAQQELKYAEEDMWLEEVVTEPENKEEKTELENKEQERKEEKKENGIDITIIKDEDKTKTVKSINGVEIYSKVEFDNGSYEEKSRNIINDGEKDDLGKTITLSENYCNFTAYQIKYDAASKVFTEKEVNPLVDNTGEVIGQKRATEVTNIEIRTKKHKCS